MKKRYISMAVCTLAAALSCLCAVSQRSQQHLAEKIIRLHVVANSDTQEDQQTKLLVRDSVLRQAQRALAQAEDPVSALRESLPAIEQAANDTLRGLGCPDTARVTLRRELFPTREYDTFRLPSGVYRTLRVSIGSAAGHNWWCVVFPSLCLPASAEPFEEVCRTAGFSEGEISLMTEQSQEIELEFKTLEWLGKLKKMLWDA